MFYCTIKASVFWMLDPLFWQNFWFLICMYVIGVYIHDTVKFMMLHYFMAWCWMWIAFYIILLKILKTSSCKIIPYCVHVLVKGSIFIYRYFIEYVRMASLIKVKGFLNIYVYFFEQMLVFNKNIFLKNWLAG